MCVLKYYVTFVQNEQVTDPFQNSFFFFFFFTERNNRTRYCRQNIHFIYISTSALVVILVYYFTYYTRFNAYTYKHWTRIIIVLLLLLYLWIRTIFIIYSQKLLKTNIFKEHNFTGHKKIKLVELFLFGVLIIFHKVICYPFDCLSRSWLPSRI